MEITFQMNNVFNTAEFIEEETLHLPFLHTLIHVLTNSIHSHHSKQDELINTSKYDHTSLRASPDGTSTIPMDGSIPL